MLFLFSEVKKLAIGNRIKFLRKEMFKLTQAKFGEKIGFKATAIGEMESGNRNVTDRAIILICNEFDLNEKWLRTGEGQMKLPNIDDALNQLSKEYNLNNIEYEFLHSYLNLDLNKRAAVVDFLKNILNN